MIRQYKYVKKYGIQGVVISAKLGLGLTKNISIPKISHQVHLRKSTSDIPTFHEIFCYLQYDIHLEFQPKVIIDAGANIGLAAIYFANKYPDSKIISIEPEASNYQQLKKNIENYKNVFPLNKGLSNKIETLNVIDEGIGSWGFTTSQVDEKIKESKGVMNTIETITISEIMEQNNFEYIDIAKIDIEGYEKELFQSNYEDWVPKTRCIIIELHDRIKQGCSKSLFTCLNRYDFSCSLKEGNLIFVNNNLANVN